MNDYTRWLNQPLNAELREELESVKNDPDALHDRFYKDLEFGTGGLRGVIGAGTNRMNIYTVRRATQGICDMLRQKYSGGHVAVGYDTRKNSALFAREVARVYAANGFTVHLADAEMPTPVVSYAVRSLGCVSGVMITASHNPAKYNGYKAYGADGGQMTLEDSERAMACIQKVDLFDGPKLADFDEARRDGRIVMIGKELFDEYVARVLREQMRPELDKSGMKIVYTPLHGAGNRYFRAALAAAGYRSVSVVPEQELPDPAFTTCPYPNPEIREALDLAIAQAEREGADLVLATDPDSDRLGAAVRTGNDFRVLTGNEIGGLLLEYICETRTALGTMPKNPVAVDTIVTTDIAKAICKRYGVELRQTLTGFKFIGEQLEELAQAGEADRYIFGFEESFSFLVGTHVRDKDAVSSGLVFAEMAAWHASQGRSLADLIERQYRDYGVYLNRQQVFEFDGEAGAKKMASLMDELRALPSEILGEPVVEFCDYAAGTIRDAKTNAVRPTGLPKSNVVGFNLADGCGLMARPSGTEPKIRLYFHAVGETPEKAEEKLRALTAEIVRMLGL